MAQMTSFRFNNSELERLVAGKGARNRLDQAFDLVAGHVVSKIKDNLELNFYPPVGEPPYPAFRTGNLQDSIKFVTELEEGHLVSTVYADTDQAPYARRLRHGEGVREYDFFTKEEIESLQLGRIT